MTKYILLISPKLKRGGADMVLMNTASLFLSKGYAVHLLLFHKASINIDERIILHENTSKNGCGVKIIEEFVVGNKINQLNKLFDFEIIISNKTSSRDWLKKHIEMKTFYYQHFDSSAILKNAKTNKDRRKVIRKNLMHFNGRNIICVSNGAKKSLLEAFDTKPKSIHVVYNFFDFTKVKEKSRSHQVSYKPYIIYAGRFDLACKRPDLLIEAFQYMKSDVNLLFLTSDPEATLALCKSHAKKDKIFALPMQENPFTYMANASCLVLCSDYEALPLVLIESLICNTPVVSTNCRSGPNEILTGELSQYLVPCNDAKSLADKIDMALSQYPVITDSMVAEFSGESAWCKFQKIINELKKTYHS